MAMHARLRDTFDHRMVLGFNASAELLRHRDFLGRLESCLARYRVPPDCVVIEVLGTVFFGSDATPDPHGEIVAKLRKMGLRVMLDDFGMGYAGLGHLAHLPVSGVKLDHSLTQNIENDFRRKEIVSALCSLIQRLGMSVVVEGIETEAQADLIRGFGPGTGQGRWFSPPLPADAVLPWLSRQTVFCDARWPNDNRGEERAHA